MQAIYKDEVLGAVTLNESHRARSISIRINRLNETITLTYPAGSSRSTAISFLESKRTKIASIRERQRAQRAANPPAISFDENELRSKAKKHLPERIAEIAAKTNLKYNKVSLRASRSRWGSCSSNNNISLSIYLMTLPQHLIDFVILHELCHTVHHNHSPKFHALLDYICQGREKELNRELHKFSIR
ncbi:MAG: M48 family metallopeptidase [Rikenellaceae bacterium]